MTTATAAVPAIPDVGTRAISRARWRLIPFIFLCYVVAYIDRVNVGFAAKTMQRDLGLSDAVYGLAAGLFFWGYCLFEVPSNLVLAKVGARIWIARIMIGWGLVSMATTWVSGEWSFYALRFVLGVAEAGFFPGIILYLTYWFPARERAKTGALFMMAVPLAIIVGAPLSAPLLAMDGLGGLRGWQWLFLIEGLPAVILGFFAFFALTDRPEDADWMPADEREWLVAEMAREQEARQAQQKHGSWRALLDGRVLLLCLIFFLNTMATYGVFLWLPRILQDASGWSGMKLSLLTSLPLVVALGAMVVIGSHSDRTGERKWHVAACSLTGALGLALAAAFPNDVVWLVLSLLLCQVGQRSVAAVFWAIPPALLGGTAAAAGIALINSIGNLGGFMGPAAMGWLKQNTQGYSAGFLVLSGGLVVLAALVAMLPIQRERRETT